MKETNRNRANVAKRRARQRKLRNRRIALTVCLMLVVMVASIGGTVAWLTAKTDSVGNTFTYGNINIELYEHKYNPSTNQLDTDTKVTADDPNDDYKIIPGKNLPKDPTVEVKAGSEACWLFVKIDKANWPAFTEADGTTKKIAYSVATGWTALEGQNGVYYREVGAVTADTTFKVLANDQVTVSENLTKGDLSTITTTNKPKLTFTAYAVQKDGITSVTDAWAKANS